MEEGQAAVPQKKNQRRCYEMDGISMKRGDPLLGMKGRNSPPGRKGLCSSLPHFVNDPRKAEMEDLAGQLPADPEPGCQGDPLPVVMGLEQDSDREQVGRQG